jgi:hypothetical protein
MMQLVNDGCQLMLHNKLLDCQRHSLFRLRFMETSAHDLHHTQQRIPPSDTAAVLTVSDLGANNLQDCCAAPWTDLCLFQIVQHAHGCRHGETLHCSLCRFMMDIVALQTHATFSLD